MTEQEEFEFRQRMEQEQAATPPAKLEDTGGPTLLEGDPNHKFDWSQIPKGAAVGGAIGGGIGAFAGGVGAVPGAVGGAVLGGLGSLAEETVRTMGGNELTAIIAGLASGGVASLGKSAVGGMVRTIHPASAAYLPRPARAALGLGREIGEEGMTRAERLVRRTQLGERPPTDFTSTKAFDSVQETLRKNLPEGVSIPEGQKVSEFARDSLYKTMDDLRTSGKPFEATTAYNEMLAELGEAAALKEVSKADIDTIKQLAKSQLDARPGVVGRSNQALLNLAQNGGKFNNKTGEAEKLISDKAQTILADKFGKYFEEAAGSNLYKDLKSIERAEIVAKVTDDIPMLIMGKMKPTQLEEMAANIKATPEGKAKFVEGLGQYFGSLPQGRTTARTGQIMLNEFERLAPTLKKTGLLTSKQLNETQKILMNIPKDISAARWKEIATNAIGSAMQSSSAAAVADNMRE